MCEYICNSVAFLYFLVKIKDNAINKQVIFFQQIKEIFAINFLVFSYFVDCCLLGIFKSLLFVNDISLCRDKQIRDIFRAYLICIKRENLLNISNNVFAPFSCLLAKSFILPNFISQIFFLKVLNKFLSILFLQFKCTFALQSNFDIGKWFFQSLVQCLLQIVINDSIRSPRRCNLIAYAFRYRICNCSFCYCLANAC